MSGQFIAYFYYVQLLYLCILTWTFKKCIITHVIITKVIVSAFWKSLNIPIALLNVRVIYIICWIYSRIPLIQNWQAKSQLLTDNSGCTIIKIMTAQCSPSTMFINFNYSFCSIKSVAESDIYTLYKIFSVMFIVK